LSTHTHIHTHTRIRTRTQTRSHRLAYTRPHARLHTSSTYLHFWLQVGTISEAYPHLILDAFSSKLGERCANILKHIFPVPKDDTKRWACRLCECAFLPACALLVRVCDRKSDARVRPGAPSWAPKDDAIWGWKLGKHTLCAYVCGPVSLCVSE